MCHVNPFLELVSSAALSKQRSVHVNCVGSHAALVRTAVRGEGLWSLGTILKGDYIPNERRQWLSYSEGSYCESVIQ